MKTNDYSIDLISACENLCIEDVKTAIEKGADVNYIVEEGSSFPLLACVEFQEDKDYNKIIEIFSTLLLNGADINLQINDDETPLMHSAWLYRSYEVVEFLLKNGANPNLKFDGETALDLTGGEICFYDACMDEPDELENLERIYELLERFGAKQSKDL
jgi:ankyrin repeat protein